MSRSWLHRAAKPSDSASDDVDLDHLPPGKVTLTSLLEGARPPVQRSVAPGRSPLTPQLVQRQERPGLGRQLSSPVYELPINAVIVEPAANRVDADLAHAQEVYGRLGIRI